MDLPVKANSTYTPSTGNHVIVQLSGCDHATRMCWHLKVTGMEHVPDDNNFFMPQPVFSFLLRPPVQLPTKAEVQSTEAHVEGENRFIVKSHNEWKCTSVAAVASSYNLCPSSSSCWHHTDPLAQIVLLPRVACNLWPLTHRWDE